MLNLTSDIAWEVGFDAGRVISAIPDTKEQMKQYEFLPFYRNIRNEGILIYQAKRKIFDFRRRPSPSGAG